jgi:hypothetical protein
MKTLILFTLLMMMPYKSPLSHPVRFSVQYQEGDTYMNIRLRGTVALANHQINGFKLTELSGLAWDEDDKLLYALSDRGYVFHLRPFISNHTLTHVEPVAAYWLQNEKNRRLESRDSEGLTLLKGNNGVRHDSELLISFEIQPRIARFTPQGKWLSNYHLPKPLQQIENYYSDNKVFEAVTIHPRFSIITAPEWPLKKENTPYSLQGLHKHTLYALDGNQQWTFPAYPAPNSAVVALETLDDGSILLLERAFTSVKQPLIISVRRLWLGENGKTKSMLVAKWDNSQEWFIDNFEGLSHHRAAYFFMVSDDNDSDSQRTLLSYWELLE